MAHSNFVGDIHFSGKTTFADMAIPEDAVGNAQIGATVAIPIDAEKVEAQCITKHVQPNGTAIVAKTEAVHVSRFGGSVERVGVTITGVLPAAAGDIVTVDVRKHADDATAGVSILSTEVTMSTTPDLFKPTFANLDTNNNLAVEDVVMVVVTVATTATMGEGVIVDLMIRENQAAT